MCSNINGKQRSLGYCIIRSTLYSCCKVAKEERAESTQRLVHHHKKKMLRPFLKIRSSLSITQWRSFKVLKDSNSILISSFSLRCICEKLLLCVLVSNLFLLPLMGRISELMYHW